MDGNPLMPLLDFNDDDLRVLNDALVQMPYGRVAPLVAKINQQITAQQKPADEAEPVSRETVT